MKPKKLLLCVDSSNESQRALEVALDIAEAGSEIFAVNVVNRHVVSRMVKTQGRTLAEAEVELEETGWHYLYAAEEVCKNHGVHVTILQENGCPEEIIPRLAERLAADLIIVGQSHMQKGDLLQGALAQQLIEHAACAVLVVK